MLEIILCDDDKFLLELEKERIAAEIQEHQFPARIACVSTDSAEVIRFIQNNLNNYLCFVDLDFGVDRLNGIDIAKQIKKLSPGSKVVFVTNHHEMAHKVLVSGVEPFGFIEKTTNMKKLSLSYRNYIQMALNMLDTNELHEDEIELSIGFDEYLTLKKSNITYVETVKTMSHAVAYHTMDGSSVTVRDSLENAIKQLGDHFIKTHRSALVNKKYIVGLGENTVILSNGEEAPCSFRMKGQVKKCIKL